MLIIWNKTQSCSTSLYTIITDYINHILWIKIICLLTYWFVRTQMTKVKVKILEWLKREVGGKHVFQEVVQVFFSLQKSFQSNCIAGMVYKQFATFFFVEWKLSKITFQYEVTKNVKQVPKIWTWYESYNSVAFSIMCCGTWPQIFESLSTISDLSPNLHISPLQYLNCHQWICHVLYYSNEITPWILVKCCCQDSHTREILQSASDSQ